MVEKSLGTMRGREPGTRVEVVQIAPAGEQPYFEIRMWSAASGLGWTIQRRVAVDAGQWELMRDAFNLADPDARRAAPCAVRQAPSHLRLIS